MSYDEAQLPNPMELPAVEQGHDMAASQDTRQQGSERNPEYLPPVQVSQNNSPGGVQQQSAATQQLQRSAEPPTTQASQQTSLSSSSPSIADDADLIEKEWVEKANEIVEKTRDNPYLQNKAISEIKSDYIKKRYNKDVSKSKE